MGYKANAKVLREFCSPEINAELSQKMNSNLAGCLDCVMAYHYARQHFLTTNETSQKVMTLNGIRSGNCQHANVIMT